MHQRSKEMMPGRPFDGLRGSPYELPSRSCRGRPKLGFRTGTGIREDQLQFKETGLDEMYRATSQVSFPTRSLEHVKHPLGDQEATENVDGRDECGASCQCLGSVGRIIATAHLKKTTDSGDSRNSVGDGHEGRVKGWSYTPNSVVSDDAAQAKGRGHGGECRVGSSDTQSHQTTKTSSVHQSILKSDVEVVWWWWSNLGHWFRLFKESKKGLITFFELQNL